jgi:ABC-type lipoprotein export system ATPase subunit
MGVANVESARAKNIIEHMQSQREVLYELEILPLDDKVEIYLNVAEDNADPEYKEAAKLSTGQKCTAILPILLLATDGGPLLIDQPENNLDNHYIFKDVVPRLELIKANRQLLFVTHNPNIPVLADAERVVVLAAASDEKGIGGTVEKIGSVEDTREEIISLLEGGREAFELRSKVYGRP